MTKLDEINTNDDIATKLSAARTRLVLDNPFLGTLVLQLPLTPVDADWCPTTATDAKKFYYNPEYIEQLSLKQTQFILSHEALHCALSHFARRNHREKPRWDIACDFAVNGILISDGLIPPMGALHNLVFDDLSAEEIYPTIESNSDEKTIDNHVYDDQKNTADSSRQNQPANNDENGNENENRDEHELVNPNKKAPPPSLDPAEQKSLSILWQKRTATAAQQAKMAGKLSEVMNRIVGHLLQPSIPWQQLLSQYMTMFARDDYNYTRPSNRRDESIIFPSLRSSQINVVVALDTSGSISDKEIQSFASEIDAIKGQIRARLTLLTCDTALSNECPWFFEPWDFFEMPLKISGGRTTSFEPVFHWINQQDTQPDVLIYFTDGYGKFPPHQPAFPVIWLIKGKNTVPWGQKITLN